jgi:hypothetical protein
MIREAVICVPARDERDGLPALLRSLAALEGPARPKVLILANNCADDTAALARAAQGGRIDLRVAETHFILAEAHAGSARRAAMAAGANWLRELGAEDGILLSTDADATPPPCWVRANVAAIEDGADAVGGRILPEDSDCNPLPPTLRWRYRQVERYWAAVRALADRIDPLPHDPPPRHGSHTGGSLAVTLAAFLAVGGIPPLRSGEDNAFVAALERSGLRLRHDPAVWTVVSARREGRAEGGMAAEMQRWDQAGDAPMLLPAAAFWRRQVQRRRQIRQAWQAKPRLLVPMLGRTEDDMAALASGSPNAIAFVARAEAFLPPQPAPCQEIEAATREMEAMAAHDILAA